MLQDLQHSIPETEAHLYVLKGLWYPFKFLGSYVGFFKARIMSLESVLYFVLCCTWFLKLEVCCRWYFADHMETDEAYVFVCFDSRLDRARFTPHTGFRDLSVGDDAPPRESIELRAYCFYENEAPQEVQRVR